MSKHDHLLDEAKQFLGIAEQVDANPKEAKRQAYMAAAERLAAYRDSSPRKWRAEAASYCNRKPATIDKLVEWHDTGYKADTPFMMDEKATTRAAVSHSKKVLRERPKEVAKEIAEAMEDPEVAKAVVAAASTKARARIKDAEREQIREDVEKMDIFAPTEEQHVALNFRDTLRKLGAQDLPNHIAGASLELITRLDPEKVSQWLNDYGTEEFRGPNDEDYGTLGDLLLDTLANVRRDVDEALDKALGMDKAPSA